MRRVHIFLILIIVGSTLAGCGGNGNQTRPSAIASFPAAGAVVPEMLGAFRVDYDEPVRILNENDVRVFANGISVRSVAFQLPGSPNSIFIAPLGGGTFPPGADYDLVIRTGAAVNRDNHYSLDTYDFLFTLGPGLPLVFGSAANSEVYLIDSTTLSLSGTNDIVPTLGAEVPLGIVTFDQVVSARAFVQLGGGDALASFVLETDAVMTPVTLSAPTTLSTTAKAIGTDRLGDFLYCAFREDDGGGIRLYKIDPVSGMEDSFIDLSIPDDVGASPAGLGIDRGMLYLSVYDDDTGRLAAVDLLTFTEVDLDDDEVGTQALVLPSGAGPIAVTEYFVTVADPTGSTATRVDRTFLAAVPLLSARVGTSIDCFASRDGFGVFQPLAGFATDPNLPFVRRNWSSFANADGIVISDLIGDTPATTTDATAMGWLPQNVTALLILDGQIATRLFWSGAVFVQQDDDLIEPGIQAIDLDVSGPGVTDVSTIGTISPAFPSAP